MKFTQKQEQALSLFKSFLNNDINVFILKGYAGTGKTTIAKFMIDEARKVRDVELMAPNQYKT